MRAEHSLPTIEPVEPARQPAAPAAAPRRARIRALPRDAMAAPEVPHAVRAHEVPPGVELDHTSLYFNRELRLLDFNWRVFAQARDPRTPLLERVRFLSIAASNLDEFFQKRVGGLKRQVAANVQAISIDGRTPAQQLE
ncbi:MAG TPA: hypothetical protein VFJ16_03110, partial [Longimicrobium sp.]|nr:hypothetical protein [Longimicrobium sp.]